MKAGDIKNLKIARKYADAIYMSAKEANIEEKVLSDLIFTLETLSLNKELSDFLLSPLIKTEDKKDVIQKLFSPHTDKITTDFLNLLAEAQRLDALSEIVNKYKDKLNEAKNIEKPLVISAVELNESQKEQIKLKLQDKLNKTIEPEFITDEAIIGGLIVEIKDRTIDCSLKTKFENMRKELIKGN